MDPRSEPYARKPHVRFCAGATSDGRRYRNTYCLRPKVSPKKSPGFQLGRSGFCAISYSNQKIDLHELDGGVEIERLVHIVRRRMVTCGNPIIVEFLGIEVGVSGFLSFGDENRRHALAHKRVLVSANKIVLIGLGVGTHLQSESRRVALYHRLESAIRSTERDNIFKGVEHARPIHIYVRHDAMDRYRRKMGEVIRAEQSFFFSGDGEEQNGSRGWGRDGLVC